jgi:ferritin-like metal-binding protein YciE
MAVQDPKELFVKLLSDVRQNEERSAGILQELSEAVEDPDIKEAIESRIFLKNQTLSTLDRCFKLIDEQPQKMTGRIQDVFIEDFRRELNEIKGTLARTLFVAAKVNHLMHFRIAEYVAWSRWPTCRPLCVGCCWRRLPTARLRGRVPADPPPRRARWGERRLSQNEDHRGRNGPARCVIGCASGGIARGASSPFIVLIYTAGAGGGESDEGVRDQSLSQPKDFRRSRNARVITAAAGAAFTFGRET